VQREREAQHGDRADLRRGAAGYARSRRATAGYDREPAQCVLAQLGEDGRPRRVELARRCRGAPTRDSVGLFHERHGDLQRQGGASGRNEVRRGDATTGAVSKHKRRSRAIDEMQVHPCAAVRCLELKDAASLAAGGAGGPGAPEGRGRRRAYTTSRA